MFNTTLRTTNWDGKPISEEEREKRRQARLKEIRDRQTAKVARHNAIVRYLFEHKVWSKVLVVLVVIVGSFLLAGKSIKAFILRVKEVIT